MKYLPIFPELAQELEELDDAQVGRMIRAMSAYAFEGRDPDFPRGSAERVLWPVFRLKIDGWRDKSEKRASAGSAGGEANGSGAKQTEANGSKPKQTEANESKPKPQSQSHTQSQTQPQIREIDTHDGTSGQEDARAREGVPASQYDPGDPLRPFDSAWRFSERARRRIAQRILDRVTPQISSAVVVVDGEEERDRIMGREIFDALTAAMAGDIPPDVCQQLGVAEGSIWRWEARLKQLALDAGSAPEDRTAVWRSQLEQLAEDLATPLALSAYG